MLRLIQVGNYASTKAQAIELGGELSKKFMEIVERDNTQADLNSGHHYTPCEVADVIDLDFHGVRPVGKGKVIDYVVNGKHFEDGINLNVKTVDIYEYNGQRYAADIRAK